MNHVLIVDDDVDAADTLRALVGGEHFSVAVAHSLLDARRQIALQQPCLVLVDQKLPDGNGLDLLSDPHVADESKIVLVTARAELDSSIKALQHGAMGYLLKPVRSGHLDSILARFRQPSQPTTQPTAPRPPTQPGTSTLGQLRGGSAAMQAVYERIRRVAPTGITVFITGESGTGKEVVARTVHDWSPRRERPFLAVNCGAISPALMESELFGHEKGSFTGADRQHQGYFERAAGGTLFLDEVTEMPLALQVKLLRVLETGEFMRVGSTRSQASNVRIVAATNRCPHEAVADRTLREDLLYRLHVFPIALPPLRERRTDIPLLAEHFLQCISAQEGRPKRFSPAALRQLIEHAWPGNVRELRNAVQCAYVMTAEEIVSQAWPPAQALDRPSAGPPTASMAANAPSDLPPRLAHGPGVLTLPLGVSVAEAERLLIEATLAHCGYQRERTAATLGISVKTLYNKLKAYARLTQSGDDPTA